MELIQIVNKSERSKIADYFLDKALNWFIAKQFSKACEFFKLVLDLHTCDCRIYRYSTIKEIDFNSIIIENHIESLNNDYVFCKAFILNYRKDEKYYLMALDSIEKYLNFQNDEYGLYIKGRLLLQLNKPDVALSIFKSACEIRKNSMSLYRIGRIKEDVLEGSGLEELYLSLMINPMSFCCFKNFYFSVGKKEIQLSDNENLLSKLFNTKGSFYFEYDKLGLKNPIVIDFLNILQNNSALFIESTIESTMGNTIKSTFESTIENNIVKITIKNTIDTEYDDHDYNYDEDDDNYNNDDYQSRDEWLRDEYGDDADTVYWNLE